MADDEAGVDFLHKLVGDAPLAHLAAAIAVDKYISGLDEVQENLAALFARSVEADGTHVAALNLGAPAAGTHDVHALGVLYPDDVGAEVSHTGGGVRAGNGLSRVDYADALKGTKRGDFVSMHSWVPP